MTDRAGREAAPPDLSRSLWRRGVLIMALFAVPWALVGASGLPAGAAWALRIAVALLAAGAIVVAFRAGGAVRPRRLPERWYRGVGLVNGGQFAAIALVVVVCVALGTPEFVPPVVCLVVGAHFFPLARLFDQPQYAGTATGLCAVAGAGLLVLLAGPGPGPSRVVIGVGAAAVLLATAWHLAVRRS